ncbi:MAG: hypothetical protein OXF06_13865 [Bacteroidetes bacterium]|nr:hypothetical protein [Bacteroidota bacterium]
MDPAHLQLTSRQHYWTSEKTALPGAIRDCAPDRWEQQLIRRAFQKSKTNQALTELDYLLALNDYSELEIFGLSVSVIRIFITALGIGLRLHSFHCLNY